MNHDPHGGPAATKRCTGPCGRDLPLDEEHFHRDAGTADANGQKRWRAKCKDCRNAERRDRRTQDPKWSAVNNFEADARLYDEIEEGGETLVSFGHPIERTCAEALLRCGSVAAAALEVQLEPRQFRAHLSELKRRAATRGYAPGNDMQKPTPEGFHVKGVSTYYGRDPETGTLVQKGQWVKTKRDEEHKIEALLDAMAGIADAWKGKAEPIDPPEVIDSDDLLCAYLMGDPHIGMLAWPAETGNKFNLEIAEQTLYSAADKLVGLAPRAKHALVVNAGDFFHMDNKAGTTTRGTPVDVDGRWPKVLATGIRVMRRIIDRALEKHEHVTVINEIGNHDEHLSIMLALCLAQFYEREPRVTVDTSPEPFHWYRFGKVLIGTHHGDRVKRDDLGEVMACDRPQDWGETLYRYFYIGHVHHDTVKELRGVIVESLRTLAGRDAWHHGQGYRSGRDMKLDVIHREFGKIDRHIVGIGQLCIPLD